MQYSDSRTPEKREADYQWYQKTLADDRLRQREARKQAAVRKAQSAEAMRRFDVTTKEGRAAALAFLKANA